MKTCPDCSIIIDELMVTKDTNYSIYNYLIKAIKKSDCRFLSYLDEKLDRPMIRDTYTKTTDTNCVKYVKDLDSTVKADIKTAWDIASYNMLLYDLINTSKLSLVNSSSLKVEYFNMTYYGGFGVPSYSLRLNLNHNIVQKGEFEYTTYDKDTCDKKFETKMDNKNKSSFQNFWWKIVALKANEIIDQKLLDKDGVYIEDGDSFEIIFGYNDHSDTLRYFNPSRHLRYEDQIISSLEDAIKSLKNHFTPNPLCELFRSLERQKKNKLCNSE